MKIMKCWTIILCAFYSQFVVAQLKTTEIKGIVTSRENIPLEGVSISLGGIKVSSDKYGAYKISGQFPEEVVVTAHRIGYLPYKTNVKIIAAQQLLHIQLSPKEHAIEEVQVTGLTKAQEVNRQAYNVTAIDATKLHNASMDVGQVLNRITGVKLRESGGMGSQMTLYVNGYSGNQLKMFLDGLPIDNYGSTFQLNNIPINYVSQVEVYKGVVPVWLGGDALGGAVNLVKNINKGNFLDVSYSYGSFNTHRATLNMGHISQNGFTVELNAYQNYSDNNYKVFVDLVPDPSSGVTVPGYAKRFHDTYKNKMLNFNVGVSNKKWADQLLVGLNLGDNYADIQTGNRMEEVFGARFRDGNIIQPTLSFRKNNLGVAGLDVSVKGSFNFGKERSVDTVYRRFFWSGESVPRGNKDWEPGGERTKELYEYKNNNGNLAATVKYTLAENQILNFNNTFTTANRKGENKLQPDNDFYKQPKFTQKNITGLGYGAKFGDHWNFNVFGKYYHQYVKAYTVYNNVYSSNDHKRSLFGYGLANSYDFSERSQVKLSFEKTYRVPELNELFGDVINLEANPDLKPESSYNLNLGFNKHFLINDNNEIYLNTGAVYRYAKDFIRYVLSSVQFDGTIRQTAQNQRDISNLGFDTELKYVYAKKLAITGAITYQNLRNRTKYETSSTDISIFYKDRIPNIPYLFGNADVSYFLEDVFTKGGRLSATYNLQYVHDYFLRWPSAGSSNKDVIPLQTSHDFNITYSFANGKYNIGIDGRNLTDALLYDNYMLQKPSRNFSVKLRYNIK